MSRGVELNYLE